MANFETNHSAAGMSAGRVTQIFTAIWNGVAARNDARITRNALSKLSARELDDIGLSFGDIDVVANRSGR